MQPSDLIALLRCPKSCTSVFLVEHKLVSEAGNEYPTVNGKPILVRQIQDLHITPPPPDKISQNISEFIVPEFVVSERALVLHLGSGNVPSSDPRVISLDVLPCENVDLVAEAEALPFPDNSFDYIASGAVFEHLYDPIAAIKEVKRILKPGGIFKVDTAFMQPYHGFPAHYFNMTPLAIEQVLVDDFLLEEASVSDDSTPLIATSMMIDRFLSYLSINDKNRLLDLPLKQVLELLKSDHTRKNPLLSNFDEYAMRSMAASFFVIAKKPINYEERIQEICGQSQEVIEQWLSLKRQYYEARITLMTRHHEIFVYRRFSFEKGWQDLAGDAPLPESLEILLQRSTPQDMLRNDALRSAIQSLKESEIELRRIRDWWIGTYLSYEPLSHEISQQRDQSVKEYDSPTQKILNQATALSKVNSLRNGLRKFLHFLLNK